MFITNFCSHRREHTELTFKFGTLVQMPDYSANAETSQRVVRKCIIFQTIPNEESNCELIA